MPDIRSIRLATVIGVSLFVPLAALAQIKPAPPASPASAVPVVSTPPAPVFPPRPNELPPQSAHVAFNGGVLSVSASNSSLNQILREISRATGIKITGGVADERVFGQYGPAAPAQILASLLDGTGSNMLLVHSDASSPGELILTPRNGGPTPPNPNAKPVDDEPEYHNPANVEENQPATPPAAAQPALPVTPTTQAAPSTSNPTSSQPTSPNGVKTPQQIFDEIQRLHSQQTTTPQQPATQQQ